MNITYLLVLMQRIGKMHEQKLKELCRQYDLSLIEAKIIAFLHNNRSQCNCQRKQNFQRSVFIQDAEHNSPHKRYRR